MKTKKEQSKSSFVPDKTKFKDVKGGYLTQSLFLEIDYDIEKAVYTFADTDKTYNGVVYPSLRKLYMEMADPTEYFFADKYLWGWEHWQKIVANKELLKEIEKWRDELEVKLRAMGVMAVLAQSSGNFNAAKWTADGHWNVKRGRPSKEEKEREKAVREKAMKEVEDESNRIVHLVRKDNGAN